MASLVFLHAHPDDEAIASAGLMAAATEAGHQVTVVFATAGERGEIPADLDGHANLGDLRSAEARAVGALLGARVEFLGYRDSGTDPHDLGAESFAAADVEEAAERLLGLLQAISADALIGYDEFGVTGHPDHRQVHVVGRRAAQLAAESGLTLWRYEGTLGQPQIDTINELMASQLSPGAPPPADGLRSGIKPGDLVVAVDVAAWLDRKRAAMAAHASQIGPDSVFLRLPEHLFAKVWGIEYYLAPGGAGPLAEFALAAG